MTQTKFLLITAWHPAGLHPFRVVLCESCEATNTREPIAADVLEEQGVQCERCGVIQQAYVPSVAA